MNFSIRVRPNGDIDRDLWGLKRKYKAYTWLGMPMFIRIHEQSWVRACRCSHLLCLSVLCGHCTWNSFMGLGCDVERLFVCRNLFLLCAG